MKKIVLVLFIVSCCCGVVSAHESTTHSTSVVNDVKTDSFNGGNSLKFGDSFGSTEMVQPSNLHGVFNSPPAIFPENNWDIWCPSFNKTVSVNYINALRNREEGLDRKVKFAAKFDGTSDSVTFLCPENIPNYYINSDIGEIGYVRVSTDIPFIMEGLIYEAVGLGVDAANARFALVFVKSKSISLSRQEGDGGFAGIGIPFGPMSRANVGSLGYGKGSGTSTGKTESGYVVKVVFFNAMPPLYWSRKSVAQKTVTSQITKDVSSPQVSAAPQVKPKERSLVTDVPSVHFETDKFQVADKLKESPHTGQLENVRTIALWIMDDIKNNSDGDEVYIFEGNADRRKDEIYNVDLAWRRGKSVRAMVVAIMEENGVSRDLALTKTKHTSAGKEYPIGEELEDNRVVHLWKGKRITAK